MQDERIDHEKVSKTKCSQEQRRSSMVTTVLRYRFMSATLDIASKQLVKQLVASTDFSQKRLYLSLSHLSDWSMRKLTLNAAFVIS
jgi:hypothetical protein